MTADLTGLRPEHWIVLDKEPFAVFNDDGTPISTERSTWTDVTVFSNDHIPCNGSLRMNER